MPTSDVDQQDDFDVTDATDEVESDTDFEQFVTFFLEEECFAFEMGAVLEIIRAPKTVAIPLTSPGLLGLANLRGAVIPVVDLRVTLGLATKEFDDSTRALIVDCGRPIALIVDRVSSVLNVEPSSIEPADGAKSITSVELLTGVIKETEEKDLIQILDADKTVAHEFATLTVRDHDNHGSQNSALISKAGQDEDLDEDEGTIQLVSLEVDSQEYAFEISEIDEIVRLPSEINKVPSALHYAVGLINLRSRLLPLVSLRRIFNLPDRELTEQDRVLVLRCTGPGGATERVGVVVDHVREVLRVPESDRALMPGVLSDGMDQEQISEVCQLEDGARLIGLLKADTLIDHPSLIQSLDLEQHSAEAADQEDDQMADTDLDTDVDDDDDDTQLVIYEVAEQEYGVAIRTVQEIIRVPETLSEVPKTPEYIAGMINLRGNVLPVARMRTRLGLESVDDHDRQRILVLSSDAMQCGYVVDSVSEVLRVPPDSISDAPELSAEESSLIKQVATLDDGKRMILILDAAELLASQVVEEVATDELAHEGA